jgi:hypothetical protein
MTDFNQDNKSIILNALQYLIMALIPAILVLKFIKNYVPEDDENKNSIEIIFEIVLQLFVIIFAIWLIDRLIRFFPTFSKINYSEMNLITILLPTLIILLTMQTKLGAKVNIVFERVSNYIFNKKEITNSGNNNTQLNTSNVHQQSRADILDTPILPPPAGQNNIPNQNTTSLINNLPNNINNNNNNNNNIPPGVMQNVFMNNEPMAANDMLGGSSLF